MRMVGPNCLGIVNTDPAVRLDATFAEPAPAGVVGLVTQSGGVAIAVQEELGRLGLGVSTAVSTGDKYDVSGNDMLLWWHGDERTRLAVLHLESFGNPRKFSRFARRLAERMPVLTVRSGSSAAGQRAAASHTASTATPRVTRDALFRQAGVLAVDRLDELTELVATLSWQPLPAGRRTAIVCNAGGVGVLAADACEAHGLIVPPLSDRTQRALRTAAAARCGDRQPGGHLRGGALRTCSPPRCPPSAPTRTWTRSSRSPWPPRSPTPSPAIAAAAAEKGTPVLAVRLGQAEHVTGLAVPGAGGPSRCSPTRPPRPGRSRRRPRARSGWRGRAAPRRTIAGIDGVRAGGVVARFLAARPEGGWLEPAQVQDVLAGVRAAGARGASSSTGRTRRWPRSPRRDARSRSRPWPTACCTRPPREVCDSGSTPSKPCAARRRSSRRCSVRACAATWSSRWRPQVPSCWSG